MGTSLIFRPAFSHGQKNREVPKKVHTQPLPFSQRREEEEQEDYHERRTEMDTYYGKRSIENKFV